MTGNVSAAPATNNVVVIVTLDGFAGQYLNDSRAHLPTLRSLAAQGAVASGMKASLPTLTWPNHVTLVTGVSPRKHAVLGNNYFERETGKTFTLIADPTFDKDEIVKAPTLYDIAFNAGLKTAAVNWPAIRGAKTLDWGTPDVHSNSIYSAYVKADLLKEFREAKIPYERLQEFCETDQDKPRDIMYGQMLTLILKQHHPNLALIHFVHSDHVQHEFGPNTPETFAALSFEDERVKDIRNVLESEFPGRATLIVTSDHGFASVRQRIQPNVKLREAGLLKTEKGKITDRQVYAFSQSGTCFVYILDKGQRSALMKQAATLFKGVEGIDQIIPAGDFKKYGLPSPENDPRMADIVLTAKDGYTFSNEANGDVVVTSPSEKLSGSHGHSPELPQLKGLFIAWGRGIKKGTTLGEIDNRDVAPTAAALLGIKMKGVEGRVLKEALERR